MLLNFWDGTQCVTRSSFPDIENNVAEAINRQSIENILSMTVRTFAKELQMGRVFAKQFQGLGPFIDRFAGIREFSFHVIARISRCHAPS